MQQEIDQATSEPTEAAAAVPQLSAKAKRKELMARAEEKGTGGEMDAYTMPKPEAAKAPAAAPAPSAKPLQVRQSPRVHLDDSGDGLLKDMLKHTLPRLRLAYANVDGLVDCHAVYCRAVDGGS